MKVDEEEVLELLKKGYTLNEIANETECLKGEIGGIINKLIEEGKISRGDVKGSPKQYEKNLKRKSLDTENLETPPSLKNYKNYLAEIRLKLNKGERVEVSEMSKIEKAVEELGNKPIDVLVLVKVYVSFSLYNKAQDCINKAKQSTDSKEKGSKILEMAEQILQEKVLMISPRRKTINNDKER